MLFIEYDRRNPKKELLEHFQQYRADMDRLAAAIQADANLLDACLDDGRSAACEKKLRYLVSDLTGGSACLEKISQILAEAEEAAL